jgi:hypothetical protein
MENKLPIPKVLLQKFETICAQKLGLFQGLISISSDGIELGLLRQ